MIFDRLSSRFVKINADFEKKKVRNRRDGKVFKFLSVGIVFGTVLPMIAGCGQMSGDATTPETTVEENADVGSDAATTSSNINTISNSAIGEYVTFGKYEQDNDFDNGPELIEWIVLDHQDGRTLLLSKYGLDGVWYNEEDVDVTWETCSLRRWLNTDFYNTAFDDKEKGLIVQITNENPDETSYWESIGREVYSSIEGNNTQDNVFLLSIDEARTYLGLSEDGSLDCICTATMYAESQGAYAPGKECWWWLRSLGSDIKHAAIVNDYGRALGQFVYHEYLNTPAVRPAIWVGEGIHGEITGFPSNIESGTEDIQSAHADNTVEFTEDGVSGLYSGCAQGKSLIRETHYPNLWRIPHKDWG